MEKINKMKVEPRMLMDSIATDMVLSYKANDKFGARCHWYQLAGAARMYEVLADKDANPVQRFALEVLRVVCELHGEDLIDVMNFIRY